MLNKKEILILNCLVDSKDKFIRSFEIAEQINMSERTVRKYIGQLQSIIEENGAHLISKQGRGYKLEIRFQIEFENFLKQYCIARNDAKDMMKDSKERQYYILNRMLFENEWVLVDDLAESLFVSRSTINHDITSIKNDLDRYHLKIISKPAKGIAITGDERDKRHLIMDYFLGKGFYSTINKYFGNLMILNEINLEELSIIVLDETREAEILLSDYILQNLVLHLALSIKRILDGKYVQNMLTEGQASMTEYLVAKNILDRVGQLYHIEFPEGEASYIGLHILSKRSKSNRLMTDHTLKQEVISVLRRIELDFGFPMTSDLQLINGIITHIEPLLLRLKNDISLENPLLEEIDNQYHDYLELTKNYFKSMKSLKNYSVTDSEWAYLTLHILAAIEKYSDRQKLNALLICATGYGSAQMLKIRVEREFHTHLNVVDVISYYDIKNYDLANVDLLISTIDLSMQLFKVPVIQVSVLLNERDIEEINQFLHIKKNNKEEYASRYYRSKQNERLINQYIKEETFHYIENEITKEEVYERLIASLAKLESNQYYHQMLRQVMYREEFSSVVFSETVAVPHPVQPIGDHSNIAVAILKNGTHYSDHDVPIKIIFMLSPSVFGDNSMKSMVDLIVNLIDSKEYTQLVMNCKTYAEFKNILLSAF